MISLAGVAVASALTGSASGHPLTGSAAAGGLLAPYAREVHRGATGDRLRINYNRWRRLYPLYNWTIDGCDGSPGAAGYTDDFYWACERRDSDYLDDQPATAHHGHSGTATAEGPRIAPANGDRGPRAGIGEARRAERSPRPIELSIHGP